MGAYATGGGDGQRVLDLRPPQRLLPYPSVVPGYASNHAVRPPAGGSRMARVPPGGLALLAHHGVTWVFIASSQPRHFAVVLKILNNLPDCKSAAVVLQVTWVSINKSEKDATPVENPACQCWR